MVLTETVIECEEQKLVFSTPVTVQVTSGGGKIHLDSSVGICGVGCDFEAAWEDFRAQIFTCWNHPVERQKYFPPQVGAREEPVKRATNFKWVANM